MLERASPAFEGDGAKDQALHDLVRERVRAEKKTQREGEERRLAALVNKSYYEWKSGKKILCKLLLSSVSHSASFSSLCTTIMYVVVWRAQKRAFTHTHNSHTQHTHTHNISYDAWASLGNVIV
jgi:hypothetical protein